MNVFDDVQEKIDRIQKIGCSLEKRDFLATWDHDEDTIRWVLLASEILEDLVRLGISTRFFDRGLGMSIFRDKSTRTRYAFKSACNLLGLATEELDEATSQIGHGETTRETAAMIGFLTEVFGIRDDMYLGEGHFYMTEVAASLAEAHRAGALMGRPSVINLQSDLDHPTQSLADLRHLAHVFGGLAGLRGRKIAMSWAYSPSYGKPLSVPQGIVGLLSRFGMHVRLAYPPGYELAELPLEKAQAFAAESGGSVQVTHSMDDAFDGADIVYPKSWAPFAIMEERTKRLRAGRMDHTKELETEALAQNAKHVDWTCTAARMERTSGRKALYMHCLPADVSGLSCERGEVDRDVFEDARINTYKQASYKPFVIASLILGMRIRQPAASLARLLQAGEAAFAARKTRPSSIPPPPSRRF
ncbi:MAG: knotted carbamoyltransferase YgeW [Polyangiaceae bacterium]|nr:knotted carbamoyltransferase YgeW [Polyangiaceae bacterium]